MSGGGGYGLAPYGTGGYGGSATTAGGSLLDRYIGPGALTLRLAGAVVPLTDAGTVTIRHGRDDADQQPDASTCTVTIRSTAVPALPRIGDPLTLELGSDAADWLGADAWDAARWRFVGNVTDLALTPARDVLGPQLLTMTAVSPKRRLGVALVDVGRWADTPGTWASTPADRTWATEPEAERVSRLFDKVAGYITPGTIDPGAYVLGPEPVERKAALELLTTLAAGTGAVLADQRDGTIDWQDAHHRENPTPAVVLTADQVLSSVSATQNTSGLVNELRVSYGTDSTMILRDRFSIARYGLAAADLPLPLAGAADVRRFATAALARRSTPRWSLTPLGVDLLRTVDVATAGQLLALELSDVIGVTGLPSTGPFSAATLYVEGWTETIGRDRWRLALSVTPAYTPPPPPEEDDGDVPPPATTGTWADAGELTWATYDPAVTWAEYLAVPVDPPPADPTPPPTGPTTPPPSAPADRWTDQAEITWATYEPSLTWAAYTPAPVTPPPADPTPPPPNPGLPTAVRWVDLPANYGWAAYDPTATWAAYTPVTYTAPPPPADPSNPPAPAPTVTVVHWADLPPDYTWVTYDPALTWATT